MNYLIFNGHRSDEMGLVISGDGTYNAPKRKATEYKIPGRNGTLIIDEGCYENITVTYPASIVRDFVRNAEALRAWLSNSPTYCRLEDSYHPDYFRLARYSGGVEFKNFTPRLRAASVSLVFDCKPQRYLKSGEIPISGVSGLRNPTAFQARPKIKFTAAETSGSIAVGNCTITFSDVAVGETITIDGETMDAITSGLQNANKYIVITGGDLVVDGGSYAPIVASGLSDFEIVPRWWTI